jgi:hypothetical protein
MAMPAVEDDRLVVDAQHVQLAEVVVARVQAVYAPNLKGVTRYERKKVFVVAGLELLLEHCQQYLIDKVLIIAFDRQRVEVIYDVLGFHSSLFKMDCPDPYSAVRFLHR